MEHRLTTLLTLLTLLTVLAVLTLLTVTKHVEEYHTKSMPTWLVSFKSQTSKDNAIEHSLQIGRKNAVM